MPSPPLVIQRFGRSNWKCWAAHIWCWPTSVVMNVSRPSARPVSWVISYSRRTACCGLMMPPRARVCVKRRQSTARQPSISSHQSASGAVCGRVSSASHALSSASSTTPASPITGTSTRTFLLMLDGSMSTWIFRLSGLNAASLPVTRSSNRAPTFSITSQPCMARFAS